MNGLIGLGATLAILLLVGMVAGYVDRGHFSLKWLVVSAALVGLNDVLLTRAYGVLPDVLGGEWNWEGKLLAMAATLAIAALPVFGWRRAGLTFVHEPGSFRVALPVAAFYLCFFIALALAFPAKRTTGEEILFQLTLPGLEEELFYRGILLFALDRAFSGRHRILGVDWGFGAVLSSILFGMAHGFGFSHSGFHLDPVVMAITGIPAFIAVWLRLRTGSLLLPVMLHNFGNLVSLLI